MTVHIDSIKGGGMSMQKQSRGLEGNSAHCQSPRVSNQNPLRWITDTIIVEGQPMTIVFPPCDTELSKQQFNSRSHR